MHDHQTCSLVKPYTEHVRQFDRLMYRYFCYTYMYAFSVKMSLIEQAIHVFIS